MKTYTYISRVAGDTNMIFYLLCSITFLFAEELQEPQETIVVEAHRNIEVYVAPIEMILLSEHVEAVISKKSVVSYAAAHWRNSKIEKPGYKNIWNPTSMHETIDVYDVDTIEYAWNNCNYKRDAKKCSNQNNHLLQETYITIDDHQIVVNMILYNSKMTIINKATYTTESQVKWIKQQEVKITQQQGMMGSQTVTHIPKEELPLKWLIPTNLMDTHIRQASIGLWSGAKIR